jgi:hypothetical protein
VRTIIQHPDNLKIDDLMINQADGSIIHGGSIVLLSKGLSTHSIVGKISDVLASGQAPVDLNLITPAVAVQDTLKSLSEDFVILKLEIENSPCIATRKEVEMISEPVWAFGFPSSAARLNSRNSDGKNLYGTFGQVSLDYKNADLRFLPSSYLELLNNFDLPSSRFLSTFDSYVGMSGGPVVDANGSLFGIFQGMYNTDNKYISGTSATTKIAFIKGEALQIFGKAKTDEIFNCKIAIGAANSVEGQCR